MFSVIDSFAWLPSLCLHGHPRFESLLVVVYFVLDNSFSGPCCLFHVIAYTEYTTCMTCIRVGLYQTR